MGHIGASAVDEVRDELLILREYRRGERGDTKERRKRSPDAYSIH
jgi:hypothetical protein